MKPLASFLAVGLLFTGTGCSHSVAPVLLPAGAVGKSPSSRSPAGYKVLHSFGSGKDGQSPDANLTAFSGDLYGTTYGGGTLGVGTIFRIDAAGAERVLHSFNYSDGARPAAGLTVMSGKLYGTTATGGAHGMGAAFSVATGGEERTLYSFKGGRNGEEPLASLTGWNGVLYGTTYGGGGGCGAVGCGLVFEVTTDHHERTVNDFGRHFGKPKAPYNPLAGLTFLNGSAYGTTFNGGASDLGAVFSLDAARRIHVLHSFSNDGSDGWWPQGNLILLNGTLYGTTNFGGTGTQCAGAGGCGTVFSVSTDGRENVIYSFTGPPDGFEPQASLAVLNGTLYGTTVSGGTGCGGSGGCGTIFSVTTSGQETVLHSFKGGKDGAYPFAGLTAFHGTLYGTTGGGGAHNDGTVFALTP